MLDLLREHQLDVMLVLIGACAATTLVGAVADAPGRRKLSLLLMGIFDIILLAADRFAYIYRGDESTLGFWMVRISNFLVFFMTLMLLFAFNLYLKDMRVNVFRLEKASYCLMAADVILVIGTIVLVVSQFTGFYYTFDEFNRYQRADGFVICYVIPLMIWLLQLSVIVRYRKLIDRSLFIVLLLFICMPLAASIMQIFFYGVSLTNLSVIGILIALRIVELVDAKKKLERANRREIELMKEKAETDRRMLEDTAYALASAIDAKDVYTHGHSSRVAEYSQKIARRAGKSEDECSSVYLAGLLHDVGKIGISESLINKTGPLTNDEYEIMKTHTLIGNDILHSIEDHDFLSEAAHFHHERYDGKGYPEGLKGEEIPELERIIAVADSYDAMTSRRSYRDPMTHEAAKEELNKGTGTQFDPTFAGIMIALIDDGEI